ncbi:universal stress protein Sll1654-like [Oscarella lobularis]|uniref:universal stress protein Sll1654-like n=1 Tax=Oscarella lobularis TaxID=121494 RepID=UPI0033132C66
MLRQTDTCYLIHVYMFTPPPLESAQQMQQQMLKHEQDAIQAAGKLMKQYKSICLSHGIRFKSFSLSGSPGESICKAAQEYDVDAIVMGLRGENTASRVSLGSVSTYALHHASVPVIIVPRK